MADLSDSLTVVTRARFLNQLRWFYSEPVLPALPAWCGDAAKLPRSKSLLRPTSIKTSDTSLLSESRTADKRSGSLPLNFYQNDPRNHTNLESVRLRVFSWIALFGSVISHD